MLASFLVTCFIFYIFNFSVVQAVEMRPSYIAGFVLDEQGQGIVGADVIVEYRNEVLVGLRSIEGGWFESPRSLRSELIGQAVRITILAEDFHPFQENRTLTKNDNFIPYRLIRLEQASLNTPGEGIPTGVIYGYVRDLVNDAPLPRANMSLHGANLEVAVVSSRDSGYFTLNYPKKMQNQVVTYWVTHAEFESSSGEVKLERQEDVFRIDMLPKTEHLLVTSYPSILFEFERIRYPTIVYGQNEDFFQVSANWGKGSAGATIKEDYWQLRLPRLTSQEFADLTFLFTRRISDLEQTTQDAIINDFLEICSGYLDSKDATLLEKLRDNLNTIISSIDLGYKIRDTQATVDVLQNIIDELEGSQDRASILSGIRELTLQIIIQDGSGAKQVDFGNWTRYTPQDPNYLFASGGPVVGTADKAIRAAELQAVANLQRSIEVKVNVEIKSYVEERNHTVDEQFVENIVSQAEGTLKYVSIVDVKETPDGYYALARIPIRPLDETLDQLKFIKVPPGFGEIARSTVIPGWGQLHKGQTKKGVAILASEAALIGGSLIFRSLRDDAYDKFLYARTRGAEKTYQNREENYEWLMLGTLIGAGAIYLYNLVDVSTVPKKVEMEAKRAALSFDTDGEAVVLRYRWR